VIVTSSGRIGCLVDEIYEGGGANSIYAPVNRTLESTRVGSRSVISQSSLSFLRRFLSQYC